MTNRPNREKVQEDRPAPVYMIPRQRGKGIYHDELQTFVRSIAYDFRLKSGDVFMEDRAVCTDKKGAIKFFEKIDADVQRIRTWQGAALYSEYVCRGGFWMDLAHKGRS